MIEMSAAEGKRNPPRMSPHFFRRENDGSARVRMRFTAEEAATIEEAAGETPLLLYIHRVLGDRARYHIRQRERLGQSYVPTEVDGGPEEDL